MTAAIGTSREIKNKDTLLDIFVPEYREVSGMLMSYEEYHVIVISNLAYFKTIRNKVDENVQFMVVKRYSDFEALHKALSERFPATVFPDLPRKVFMVKDSTPKERRQIFDNLMRFIASSTKVCCSNLVLTFLGVKPETIHRIEEGKDEGKDEDESKEESADEKELPQGSVKRRSNILSSGSQQSSLFSDEQEDEFDFFQDDATAKETNSEDVEDDLFTTNSVSVSSGSAKKDTGMLMFSDNLDDMTDMNNAAGIYLPPGADETDKKSEFLALEEEDDKDLFNIEDDLDQLLSDVVKKPQKPTEKPSLKPKPPSSPTKKTITAHRPTPAPRPAGKPGKAPPKPAPRKDKTPSAGGSETEETTKKDEPIETMDDGDIMKYIQENAGEENASLDLF